MCRKCGGILIIKWSTCKRINTLDGKVEKSKGNLFFQTIKMIQTKFS